MFSSKKDSSRVKNILLQWILQNIFNFMKGNVILAKVDEMYNILKSASHSLFVEMKVELDDQSFCWSFPLNVHTLTAPLLY